VLRIRRRPHVRSERRRSHIRLCRRRFIVSTMSTEKEEQLHGGREQQPKHTRLCGFPSGCELSMTVGRTLRALLLRLFLALLYPPLQLYNEMPLTGREQPERSGRLRNRFSLQRVAKKDRLSERGAHRTVSSRFRCTVEFLSRPLTSFESLCICAGSFCAQLVGESSELVRLYVPENTRQQHAQHRQPQYSPC
jgi:hypothetical protein